MENINPKLRMHYPYSASGKMRWFPKGHYMNTSHIVRSLMLVTFPLCVWGVYKIDKAVNSPSGEAFKAKRKDVYTRNIPFKPITDEMVK